MLRGLHKTASGGRKLGKLLERRRQGRMPPRITVGGHPHNPPRAGGRQGFADILIAVMSLFFYLICSMFMPPETPLRALHGFVIS